MGAALDTISYGYGDSSWKDLLTSYDGQLLASDEIGNLADDGTRFCVLCGEEFFQEVIWMIKESFLLFISAIVWNSLLLRCGIEDAFLFKKTHREERSYYALNWRSRRLRILLPYRELIPCYAPRHMRFFQIARKVNLTVLAVAGIICILSWNNRALEVFGYVFMGCYFFIYIIPFFIYTIYMKNAPGKPKGFDFSKSHNP